MDKAEHSSLRNRIAAIIQHIPGGAVLFAVVALVIFGYFGWYYYGADHLDHALYSLRLEKLAVTPQPPWIKAKVAEEVYQNGRLDRISLLDARANAAIAQAFETHHWVDTTTRVSKAVGGRVTVDLVYRQPIAMVFFENRNEADPSQATKGFFPIDEAGTVLPTADFSSDDVWDYFMIIADEARPAGDTGMPYGDVRITQALQLCQLLAQHREAHQLQEVWVHHDNLSAGASPWSLTVVTRDKLRAIVWGHAPEYESRGELPADEKLNRMLSWLKQPLPVTPGEVQRIDLRMASSPTTPVSRQQ